MISQSCATFFVRLENGRQFEIEEAHVWIGLSVTNKSQIDTRLSCISNGQRTDQ